MSRSVPSDVEYSALDAEGSFRSGVPGLSSPCQGGCDRLVSNQQLEGEMTAWIVQQTPVGPAPNSRCNRQPVFFLMPMLVEVEPGRLGMFRRLLPVPYALRVSPTFLMDM